MRASRLGGIFTEFKFAVQCALFVRVGGAWRPRVPPPAELPLQPAWQYHGR